MIILHDLQSYYNNTYIHIYIYTYIMLCNYNTTNNNYYMYDKSSTSYIMLYDSIL